MDKKPRKSASKWDLDSEHALLELWAEKMEKLRGVRKNSHILMEMVVELQEQGYEYTVVELKTKMHNLTARFRKEQKNVKKSGGLPSEWSLYKDMEELMDIQKSYYAEDETELVDSIKDINSTFEILYLPASPLPSPSAPAALPSPTTTPAAAPRKKDGLNVCLKKIENNIGKMHADLKEATSKIIAIEKEKLHILKAYVEREAEVQEALVEFLRRQ